METTYKNIAFYSFYQPGYDLVQMKSLLLERMRQLGIYGTILLAPEGINASLCGIPKDLDFFTTFIFEKINIVKPEIKISFSGQMSFQRSLVKVKRFIVAQPGRTPIDPIKDHAPYLSPEQFHQWFMANKKMIILDTRNDYEFNAGRFAKAIHLGTKHFADFENDIEKTPAEWQNIPIVTFCTGGIRCEKAAPLMLKKGFKEVYQLEGGILNYFKIMGQGHFEGDCFIFDERVTLPAPQKA